jgi:hypothetical protein
METPRSTNDQFVFSYADDKSADGNAMHDWSIGAEHGLVGSGKSATVGKQHTWVVLKSKKSKDGYLLGYTGALVSVQPERQVWAEKGGKTWKYIFSCTHHILLGDLDTFCAAHDLDRKIFTTSLMFGHPRAAYLPALEKAAAIVMSAPAQSTPALTPLIL